jgi:hypothetical protein
MPSPPFPEGWQLGAESWRFHRQFFAQLGRPTTQGEYSAILAQIRYYLAPKLDAYRYRVTLLDGSSLIVKGGRQYLAGVETADWSPPRRLTRRSASPAPAKAAAPPPSLQPAPQAPAPPIASPPSLQPAPQAPAPPIASPLPRQPLRASTLTLGSPAAARALAERLRRAGISEHAAGRHSA